MKLVIYSSLVLFFTKEIKDIHSLSSGRPTTSLGRPPTRYLSYRVPSGRSNNPCERTKVNKRAFDAHVACHTECMAIKISVSNFYSLYPDYKTVKYLYDKCGFMNEGKCNYFRKAAYFPICYCYTSDGLKERRTPLFVCTLGIPFIRKVTNAGIGLQRCATGFGKKTGGRLQTGNSLLEQENKEDEPERAVLVTDWQISGTIIRAILDTGAGVTLIPQKFAKDVRPLEQSRKISGMNNEHLHMVGKATVDVQIQGGITIAVTGLVSNIKFDLILGNDFFVKHAAKINISKGSMELLTNGTNLEIPIKFRRGFLPDQTSSLSSEPGGYTGLYIQAQLNGQKTKILIDTGSSSSVIGKDFINPEEVRPMNSQSLMPDGTLVKFKGETDFKLLINGELFTGWALVPEFPFTDSLVTGNTWNKYFVELVDYEQRIVQLKLPDSDKHVITRAHFAPPHF